VQPIPATQQCSVALEWSFGSHGDDEIATRLARFNAAFYGTSLLTMQAGQNRQLPLIGRGKIGKNNGTPATRSKCPLRRPPVMRRTLAREFKLLSGLFLSSWTRHPARSIFRAQQKGAFGNQQDPDPTWRFAERFMVGGAHEPIICGNHLVHRGISSVFAPLGIGLAHGHYCFQHTTSRLPAWRASADRGELDHHWTTQGSR